MSADMMVICDEDKSNYEGGNTENALFVDETSMGEPYTEFGVWFQRRFCGAPGLLEQLGGIKDHRYTEVTSGDVLSVKENLEKMKSHDQAQKQAIVDYMQSHVGKHISTENW